MGLPDDDIDMTKAVVAALKGADGRSMAVKKLKKEVLISMQLDSADKKVGKCFKKAVKGLESDKRVRLSEDGIVTLSKSKNKDGKKKKDKRKREGDGAEEATKKSKTIVAEEESKKEDDGVAHPEEMPSEEGTDKNKKCKGNPLGCTRLFVGNLPFAVDETSLASFFSPAGEITHIRWITDVETGKFYGSSFVEMSNSKAAAAAVAMAGQKLMGRDIKVNFAQSRPGDPWPPQKKISSGEMKKGGQAGGSGKKAMREKPEDCVKLFMGNISYEADDDKLTKFFANVDAEVKGVRLLQHDSGEFKGK